MDSHCPIGSNKYIVNKKVPIVSTSTNCSGLIRGETQKLSCVLTYMRRWSIPWRTWKKILQRILRIHILLNWGNLKKMVYHSFETLFTFLLISYPSFQVIRPKISSKYPSYSFYTLMNFRDCIFRGFQLGSIQSQVLLKLKIFDFFREIFFYNFKICLISFVLHKIIEDM